MSTGIIDYSPLVVPEGVELDDVPRRSYDFNKGDRRFADLEEAIEHGNLEAIMTGVRQVVRVDPGSYTFQKLYLVQAIGS